MESVSQEWAVIVRSTSIGCDSQSITKRTPHPQRNAAVTAGICDLGFVHLFFRWKWIVVLVPIKLRTFPNSRIRPDLLVLTSGTENERDPSHSAKILHEWCEVFVLIGLVLFSPHTVLYNKFLFLFIQRAFLRQLFVQMYLCYGSSLYI